MPRAEWNTSIEVWTNDGFDSPSVFRFAAPARVVPDEIIDRTNNPEQLSQAYITYNGPLISAGTFVALVGGWGIDWTTADLIIDLGTGLTYKAIYTDRKQVWRGQPVYRRAHVFQLP